MKLAIIVGSTRPGRQTHKQAKWIANTANDLEDVTADIIDLKDYDMPFFDEPASPRYNPNRVVHESVKPWLAALGKYEAYVFTTPEYNHSITGVLKNAIDYITSELNRKPSAIASHGSTGGARAAMHLREILGEAQSAVIPKAVAMRGLSELVDEEGNLSEAEKANPYGPQAALEGMLTELKWYSDALSAAR